MCFQFLFWDDDDDDDDDDDGYVFLFVYVFVLLASFHGNDDPRCTVPIGHLRY